MATTRTRSKQVERYIKQLLAGGLTNVKGRPIKNSKDTAFYGFIVADIVGKMDDWTFSWRRTPDVAGSANRATGSMVLSNSLDGMRWSMTHANGTKPSLTAWD
jgi:hypothetical protein